MLLRIAIVAGFVFIAYKIYRVYREISAMRQKKGETAKDITSQAKVLDEKEGKN